MLITASSEQLQKLIAALTLLEKNRSLSRVGIFDSGIGGLTVLPSLLQGDDRHFSFVYRGDTEHFPYGEKTGDQLVDLVIADITALVADHVGTIGIACNTASVIWHQLCQQLPTTSAKIAETQIVDTISCAMRGISAIARRNDSLSIGIIGTRLTVQSGFYKKSIEEAFPGTTPMIIQSARQELVTAIEQGDKASIAQEIERIKHHFPRSIDIFILGCTHYAHAAGLLQLALPHTRILDPSSLLGEALRAIVAATDTELERDKVYFTGERPELPIGLRWLERLYEEKAVQSLPMSNVR